MQAYISPAIWVNNTALNIINTHTCSSNKNIKYAEENELKEEQSLMTT